MAAPQLPRICELMTPAWQALLAARPRALGRPVYESVLAGWEAQAAVWRKYVADEVNAGRLPFSTGDALLELGRSEFWAEPDRSAQKSVGEVTLTRVIVNTNPSGVGVFTTGTIREGHRFARAADEATVPKTPAAQYSAAEAVYVAKDSDRDVDIGGGNFSHVQTVTVPVVAASEGTNANTPNFGDETGRVATSVDALFDPLFLENTLLLNCAGGSTGLDDPWIRIIAAAELAGFFGPTDAALIAGAMEVSRVRHIWLELDAFAGITNIFIADSSWACSDRLRTLVTKNIKENWLGFGCRMATWPIFNVRIGIEATVMVDGPPTVDDAEEIRAAVRADLRSYFDERPDFFRWDTQAIRSVIAHAHKRLLTCTTAKVLDQISGVEIPTSSGVFLQNILSIPHWMLIDDAVRLTFNTTQDS